MERSSKSQRVSEEDGSVCMTVDKKTPEELTYLQSWFGKVITKPMTSFEEKYHLPKLDKSFAKEADFLIEPGPKLSSCQRIAIYNQQYWWRFLKLLQNDFPLLVRLFGYRSFNEILASSYIKKYPINHWSLYNLGALLPKWIEESYQNDDKSLVLLAAKADVSMEKVFSAADQKSLDPDLLKNSLDSPVYLQNKVCIFKGGADIFSFREKILAEEVEYWQTNDFPELFWGHTHYFLVFRTKRSSIFYKEIAFGQYTLLKAFEMGANLENACSLLPNDVPVEDVQKWFCEWAKEGFFTMEKTHLEN